MSHSRQRSGSFRGRSRRQTAGEEGPGGSGATSVSSSSSVIVGAGSQATEDGLTIVRIRGSVQAYLKTSDAANGGFHCALGMAVVSNDAFAVGVTAVPNPIDDMLWDGWMYLRFFDIHSFGATIAESMNASGLGSIQFEIDSKAMRKLQLNDTLVCVLQAVELSTATMSLFLDSRLLVKIA